MLPTPLQARLLLYGGFGLLLLVIVTGHTADLMPARLAPHVSANSEGVLILLGVCAYLDFVRPRLIGARGEHAIATLIGVVLLAAGLVLKYLPWPISVVTLNEAVIALGFLVVYLQWRRPVGWYAWIVPGIGVASAALAPVSGFMTDMAEASAALLLVPLVLDVIDPGLLRAQVPHVNRNLVGALGLMVAITVVHLLTPQDPQGWVENVLYYVRRTTESWIAAAVVLVYYLARKAPHHSQRGSSIEGTQADQALPEYGR